MEVSDMKNPPFVVFTFREGHLVVEEDAATEVAARMRFASAVDLCETRDDLDAHRVELRAGADIIDTWPKADRS